VEPMLKRMGPVGEKEGIKFSYGGNIANTLNSHRLIHYSKKFQKEDQVISLSNFDSTS
jgi:predicted DsbA family dithiol-disulfide isomerase